MAAVRLLERHGFEVRRPRRSDLLRAARLQRRLPRRGARRSRATPSTCSGPREGPIVIPSGSCADMVIHQYEVLFADEPECARPRARRGRARERAEPVPVRGARGRRALRAPGGARRLPSLLPPLARPEGAASSRRRSSGTRPAPELVPFADQDECCGFGGVFSIKMPEISASVMDRKLAAVEASGADRLVSCDLGCLLHLAGGLRRRGSQGQGPALRGSARRGAAVNAAALPPFPERARAALGDANLHVALERATGAARLAPRLRLRLPRRTPSASATRSGAPRWTCCATSPSHLERFEERLLAERRARALGGGRRRRQPRACWRSRAAHDVRRVVKSKSMATEETHLNEALEAAGLHVVETDLGEYVVQIGRDRPSHIILPIIHLPSRGRRPADARDDRRPLQRRSRHAGPLRAGEAARGVPARGHGDHGRQLRRVGDGHASPSSPTRATGAWSSTLPRVHVVMMGIERLVPTMADLDLALKLLARSATGQKLTTYTNLIRGPAARAATSAGRRSCTWCCSTTAAAASWPATTPRSWAASAAAPASTCARSTRASAAMPTATSTRGRWARWSRRACEGVRGLERAARRQHALRRLPRRLPAAPRHPAHAPRPARPGDARGAHPRLAARGHEGLRLGGRASGRSTAR